MVLMLLNLLALLQEALGRGPQRSFFGRMLAAVGGATQDPRRVLGSLETEVTALDRLRQALHAGELCCGCYGGCQAWHGMSCHVLRHLQSMPFIIGPCINPA